MATISYFSFGKDALVSVNLDSGPIYLAFFGIGYLWLRSPLNPPLYCISGIQHSLYRLIICPCNQCKIGSVHFNVFGALIII